MALEGRADAYSIVQALVVVWMTRVPGRVRAGICPIYLRP
jgi:hypothetical protein